MPYQPPYDIIGADSGVAGAAFSQEQADDGLLYGGLGNSVDTTPSAFAADGIAGQGGNSNLPHDSIPAGAYASGAVQQATYTQPELAGDIPMGSTKFGAGIPLTSTTFEERGSLAELTL